MQKINEKLLKVVSAMGEDGEDIDLIIYCKNLNVASSELEKFSQVVLTKKFPFINAIGARAKPNLLEKIANLTVVKHVTYAASVFAQIDNSKKVINVSAFHSLNIFGDGINVAVIDTGCSSHFDLSFPKQKIICFKDLINGKKLPYDDNGHGTFVCGLIAGNGLLSGGKFSGIAPKCNIISVKALDEKGETSAFQILEAMQWVYDNREKYNIKIVCMSFGSNPIGSGDPLAIGAEKLWNSGVVVVAAGGNSGPEEKTIKSPGVSQRIITVGALDAKEEFKIAQFSSRGPTAFGSKPDILAPGVDINGLDFEFGSYRQMSGTSMSTPIVAGVCALMLEKWPNYSPDQIKMKIMQSGHKIVFNRNEEGAGYIDCSKIF